MTETIFINKGTPCVGCGALLNAAARSVKDVEVAPPKSGDGTACLNCGAVMIFNTDMTLRWMTPEEFDTLSKAEKAAMRDVQRFVKWNLEHPNERGDFWQ